jgi:hypothetical protein
VTRGGEGAPPASDPAATPQEDPDDEQLMIDWLRDSANAVATVVLRMLAACPVRIVPEPHEQQITRDSDSPNDEDAPPAGVQAPG